MTTKRVIVMVKLLRREKLFQRERRRIRRNPIVMRRRGRLMEQRKRVMKKERQREKRTVLFPLETKIASIAVRAVIFLGNVPPERNLRVTIVVRRVTCHESVPRLVPEVDVEEIVVVAVVEEVVEEIVEEEEVSVEGTDLLDASTAVKMVTCRETVPNQELKEAAEVEEEVVEEEVLVEGTDLLDALTVVKMVICRETVPNHVLKEAAEVEEEEVEEVSVEEEADEDLLPFLEEKLLSMNKLYLSFFL